MSCLTKEDLINCEICGKITRKSINPKVTHHVCLACHLNNRKHSSK